MRARALGQVCGGRSAWGGEGARGDPRLALVQESGSQQNPAPVDAPAEHGVYPFPFSK